MVHIDTQIRTKVLILKRNQSAIDERKVQGLFSGDLALCFNELLVQQRQPFKDGWPNMWDLTAAGSALQGENSCQAAEREVAEEIGLKLDLSDKRADFTINFANGFDD